MLAMGYQSRSTLASQRDCRDLSWGECITSCFVPEGKKAKDREGEVRKMVIQRNPKILKYLIAL